MNLELQRALRVLKSTEAFSSEVMDRKVKPVDPGTCRIFFSSPFGGMEEEREELTKKYFPQIHHACNAKGIKFVPVDMRWGITTEAAENAQVMNICLREVSRSDFFVGFFGQRYGWHSAHSDDSILVENFEQAMDIYPWVDTFKDRSMTEIEFRAGHLNNPGAMPTCFCFRDKAYDDYMKEEGEKNQDAYQVMKFTIENEHADQMRSNLIQEIVDTQDKTWGVKSDCKNPQEMAKFIFDTLWKYLTEVVLVDLNEVEVPYLVQQRLLHDQFVMSASHIYCGCEEYLDQLMNKVTGPPTKGTVVTGPAGCGKSALLAKWMQLIRQTHPYVIVIYHFIGCAPGTERPRNILERILLELRESFPHFESKTPAPGDDSNANKDEDGKGTSDESKTENNEGSVSEDTKVDKSEISDQNTEKTGVDHTKNEEEKDENSNKKVVDDQKTVSVEDVEKTGSTSSSLIESAISNDPVLDLDDKLATNIFIVPKMAFDAKVEEDTVTSEEDKVSTADKTHPEEDKKSSDEDKVNPEDKKATEEDKKATDEDKKATEEDKKAMDEDKKATDEDKKATEEDKKATEEDKKTSKKEKNDADQKEEGKEKKSGLEKKSTQQVVSELNLLMTRITEDGHKVVIILDALNQQKVQDKTIKHLYWLPETFPDGITFVCSTLDTDTASHDLLISQRGMDKLVVNPFDSELQKKICVETLKVAGKELSPHQLERVINAKETSNALFLKLVLYELSIYGSFSQLDNKINSLIYVNGVKPLLQVILERLELDYCSEDYKGNLVKDVLCCLIASRKGLSESELTEILKVPTHLWSPLFFALEHLLAQYTGLLGFAFTEMRQAVVERYLSDTDHIIPYKQKLIKYFNSIRATMKPWTKNSKPEYDRVIQELPWLQIDINDKEDLILTLSDLSMLRKIASTSLNDLLYLWQQTGLPWSAVSNRYMAAFDQVVCNLHQEMQNGVLEEADSPGMKIRVTLQHMRMFFSEAYYAKGCQRAMEREIRVLETCKSSIKDEKRAEYLRDARYYLAMSYSEQQDTDRALPMYMAIHEECEKLLKEPGTDKQEIKEMLAFTSNGIGLIYYHIKDMVQAEKYLMISKNIHKEMAQKMHEGASTTNLGLAYLDQKNYKKALEYFNEAMQLYEDHFFGKISIDIGNLYTNMALTYRRMKQLDKAEEYYHKSLEMKAMNVGWNHPVIATAYMNLGTLEVFRKNHVKAEEWTRKAISIYERNEFPTTDRHHRMCRENLCVNILRQGDKKKVLPLYREITHILVDNNWVNELIVSLHRDMLDYMLDLKMYDEVEKFTLAILASSKRRTRFAHILADLDSRRPPKDPRPPELTLEAFLKEYPDDAHLKILYASTVLAKEHRMEELIEMCHRLHEEHKELEESAYSFAAESLCDNKFPESSWKMIQIGLEKYPNNLELLQVAISALLDMGRPEDLIKYVPAMVAAPDFDTIRGSLMQRLAMNLESSHPLPAGKLYHKLLNAPDLTHRDNAKEKLEKLYPDGLPSDSENTVDESPANKEGSQENLKTISSNEETVGPDNTINKGDDETTVENKDFSTQDPSLDPAPFPPGMEDLLQIPHQAMSESQNSAVPTELIQHQAGQYEQSQAGPSDIAAQNDILLMSHQGMSEGQNVAIPSDILTAQNDLLQMPHQAMSESKNYAILKDIVNAQNKSDMPGFRAHQAMSEGQNASIPSELTSKQVLGQNNDV